MATENERLTLNNEEKSAKFENIESFRLELESDIKKVIEENERLENVIWDKDQQIESLQDNFAKSEIKLTGEMQAQLNNLTSANERINAELESKFKEVANWKKVYDEVDHSLKLKETSFAKSKERENLLEHEHKQLKNEKIGLTEAMSKLKRENLTLESAIHEYESEMENLKRCLNETTRDVKSREHTVSEQESLLLEIRVKLESLQATLKSRDTEDARLRTTVGEKEGIILQKNKLHAELEKRLKVSEIEIGGLSEDNTKLSEQVENLVSAINEAQNSNKNLDKQNYLLKNDQHRICDQLQNEKQNCEEQCSLINSLEIEKVNFCSEKKKYESTVEDLRKENGDLNLEVKELEVQMSIASQNQKIFDDEYRT